MLSAGPSQEKGVSRAHNCMVVAVGHLNVHTGKTFDGLRGTRGRCFCERHDEKMKSFGEDKVKGRKRRWGEEKEKVRGV